jgi:hypothetical protein
MKTNVKATNWPKRNDAAHNMPRESRKGQNVASPRKREARLMSAAERSIADLLERAQRKFSRIDREHINVAHMNASDRASDKIVDKLQQSAVALAKRNAQ